MKPSSTAENGTTAKSIVALIDMKCHSSKEGGSNKDFVICSFSDPSTDQPRDYLCSTTRSSPPHSGPKTSSTTIYEIQSISKTSSSSLPSSAASTPQRYSSFFVKSQVLSNPNLHLIHPIDPLFFLLSKFSPTSTTDTVSTHKWQPWDQIVRSLDMPQPIFQSLPSSSHNSDNDAESEGVQYAPQFFDISDQFGDDLLLYKFQQKKVILWLQKKVDRIIAVLRKKQDQSEKHASQWKNSRDRCNGNGSSGNGSFSASFRLLSKKQEQHISHTENTNATGTKKSDPPSNVVETYLKHSAVQILCEYLSSPWRKVLLECDFVQMNEEDLLSLSALRSKKRRLQQEQSQKKKENDDSKDGQEGGNNTASPSTINQNSMNSRKVTPPPSSTLTEADKLMQYTMGAGNVSNSDAPFDGLQSEKNEKKRSMAKSVGLKRLEKVNTKGMKSLTSFFGGGAVKKNKSKRTKII